ncbi:hypothetical protein HZA99_01450 [Candidatus Woesearchaeota archaeon]|nr:hypothetical protein [Candidatus Woesearchaeota archaeon]
MAIRGHTLSQSRPGFKGKSVENTSAAKGHIVFQDKSVSDATGNSGGFSAVTGRGLKRRGSSP